jgi:hypothetical protein
MSKKKQPSMNGKRQPSPIFHNFYRALVNLCENPISCAILAAVVYLIFAAAGGRLFAASKFAYYNYLADAFLHGQFSLRLLPEYTLDLSLYNGQYFLNMAPFPAVLLMPFVALFGVSFNDVLFTALVAGLCVGLFAQLLRKADQIEFIHVTKNQRALLVVFLAFGTVLLTLASKGKVWQTAQVVAFAFTILAYLAALTLKGKKAWFLIGLALACAMLSRPTSVFVGIFVVIYLFYREKTWNWKRVLQNLLLVGLPMILGLGFFLFYNTARFGNALETGLSYHTMSPFFAPLYEKYGASSIHYFPINLYYEYIYYPLPFTQESMMGGSLFLLSPLFFAVFPAILKSKPRCEMWGLLASILVAEIPIMLHMSTGWITFGPRYTLDFTVPLLLLTAKGMKKWKTWIVSLLVALSVAQYMIGTIAFLPFE